MDKLFVILLILPFSVFAQKGHIGNHSYSQELLGSVRSSYKHINIGSTSEESVRDYLMDKGLISDQSDIVLLEEKRSLAGVHYAFRQLIKGVLVYHSQIKVNLDLEGNIRSIFDNSYAIDGLSANEFPTLAIVDGYIGHLRGMIRFTEESVYFSRAGSLLPVKLLTVWEEDHSNYEVILNSQGEVLYIQDLNRYFMQDSIVSAKVFFPDPLTSAEQVYGGSYSDNSDGDNTELNAELYEVTMSVDFNNDTFRLSSPYVEIQEFSGPVTTIAFSETPMFSYTRSQQEFEDVNSFYHLSAFKDYMEYLGFLNLVDYTMGVDAHALNGSDNSMYSAKRLYFGEGCVDDAEDADVIIHEYGHAITAHAAPNTWVGSQRKAMDEGLGDYFATSYSRNINPFNWEKMFSWDGHNSCWPGRTMVTTKQYPGGLSGDIHADGEIWASTLMQIWEMIGGETADQITLQSLYSYAQNISMTDAAYLYLDADSLLNGGANYVSSYYWFELRGILPSLPAGFTLIAVNHGSTDVSCNSACDGTASVEGYAGVPPYTYLWSDINAQTTANAVGLCEGPVTVIVWDSLGDSSSTSYNIAAPALLTNTISATMDSGNAEGTISVIVSGGVPPYSYAWDDSQAQSTATATGLTAGFYNVTVTDANDCVIQDNEVVMLFVNMVPGPNKDIHFVVSPNPVDNVFQLVLSDYPAQVHIKLYNYLGKLILESSFYGATQISTNNFPAGAYLMQLNSEHGEVGRQIIIVK